MDEPDRLDLDRLSSALLLELAIEPDSECWRKFDELYYEIVWKYLRANQRVLGERVARYLRRNETLIPRIRPEEADEIFHEATKLALRRVRDSAGRFDPTKGTPTYWVLGAAEWAFVDVVKQISRARRSEKLLFVSPEMLHEEPDPRGSPEEQVLKRINDEDVLTRASMLLTDNELAAVRLVITAGYSYKEAAKLIFGDPSKTKQIDGVLTRAKRKLAEGWNGRSSVTAPVRRMMQDPNVLMEGRDE